MKDILTNSIDVPSAIKLFLKTFSNYNFEYNNGSVEFKDINGTSLKNIVIDEQEYIDEITNIVKYEKNCIFLNNKTLIFCLYDRNNLISDTIKLEGSLSGEIKADIDSKSLILTNLSKFCNNDNLEAFESLESILKDKLVQCEIRNIEEIDDVLFNKIKNAIISIISFNTNILLEDPYISPLQNNNIITVNDLNTFFPEDLEPIIYFNSAEKVTYPHIKYLEYYHVLEYYFLSGNINMLTELIDRSIKRRILIKDSRDNEFNKIIREMNQIYNNDVFSKELPQLKFVINSLLTFDLLVEIIKKDFDSNVSFLTKSLFDIIETTVDVNHITQKKNSKLKDSFSDEDKKHFCDSLSIRIYKIRNYIVHTKKGEQNSVFMPTSSNFNLLKDDIKLLRSISYTLLIN